MTWIIPLAISLALLTWAFWALICEWCGWPVPNIVIGILQTLGRLMVAVFAILIVWLAWALLSPARAHEADTGFRYDGDCCSDNDCRPADPGEVKPVDGWWFIVPSGIFVPHGDVKIHDSPDGRFHACNVVAGDRTSDIWCLYVPPFGS